jgi:hypothetical protein
MKQRLKKIDWQQVGINLLGSYMFAALPGCVLIGMGYLPAAITLYWLIFLSSFWCQRKAARRY